jgi:hypothetical protein
VSTIWNPNKTNAELVDDALDEYCRQKRHLHGSEPNYFRARDIADILGVETGYASTMLNQHRWEPNTRYVQAHQGKPGPNAKRRILRKPGSNPRTVTRARTEHVKHLGKEMTRRYASDLVRELYPGIEGDQQERTIRAIATDLQGAMESAVDKAIRRVDALNGR